MGTPTLKNPTRNVGLAIVAMARPEKRLQKCLISSRNARPRAAFVARKFFHRAEI